MTETQTFDSPYVNHMHETCITDKTPYIANLPSLCNMFLVSHYNFSVIINEWPTFLAVMIAKTSLPMNKAILSRQISDYFYDCDNQSLSINENEFSTSQFSEYLNLFQNIRIYSDEYYKKYSLAEPYETLCQEICNSLKNQSWHYNIALLASIKYNLSVLSHYLTHYTSQLLPGSDAHYHAKQIDEGYRHSVELFLMLSDEPDTETVYNAIKHGTNIVTNLLDTLAKIF